MTGPPTTPFGAYQLVRWISAGPDGAAYEALDPNGRELELRHVTLGGDLAGSPLAAFGVGSRTRRIALLSILEHPHVLPVLDAGERHVVLERSAGSWLDRALHPATPEGWITALQSLLQGLAAAHEHGIVHGALGPADVRVQSGRARLDLTGLRVGDAPEAPLAPELGGGAPPTRAADVWSAAAIVSAAAPRIEPRIAPLIEVMLASDPEARPSAADAAARLASLFANECSVATRPAKDPAGLGELGMGKLGPYELLDELGAGGMGRVYRARDAASGAPIALKVLDPHWAKDPEALTRFEREARILARVQSPFIARFIEAGSWLGQHYLAMELVPGLSAQKILRQSGPMSSAAVLSIGACVGRALAEVHALGLVHRDVKPGNVIVHTGPSPGAEPGSEPDPERPRAKLCDFGIARSVSDGEALTVAGTPGTPYYMAPEQVRGEIVDARADVYALGATLFELASGQPPYTGEGMAVMLAHVTDPVPDLRARRPDVAPELASIVTRALAKEPGERFRDAREMLEAIETALHGEAVREDALPQPIDLAGTPVVYDNAWDLVSAPAELWPHVSNTERLNRAIGLDDVAWELSPGDGGPVRNGTLRAAGMVLRWKENPFEWVAPHRLGVVREHSQGPFEWLRNTVVLTPREGGGTTLRHTIEIKPRGIVGRLAAGIEVGLRMRRALERVYRRIDDACVQARGGVSVDPFERGARLSDPGQRLAARLDAVARAGGDPIVLSTLERFVRSAPAQRLGRIRPRAWAREHELDEGRTLATLLRAAHEGVLVTLWDILCPLCRIPSDIQGSLSSLRDHGRCEACDLDFELDLARSVELVLRVHPEIRAADLGVYCIGGPAHSPHVLAQVRLQAGQRVALDLELAEGAYRVVARGLPAWSFHVHPKAALSSWELPIAAGLGVESSRSLLPGKQRIVASNDAGRELVVRIETASERADALTAAEAASSALFRELFPGELLAPEELVSVSKVSLLFAEGGLEGDERARFREVCVLLARAREAAALEGGALVKLHGDAIVTVFHEPAAALRAALRLARPGVRASIHAGPALMTTLADRLDYFGRTVQVAAELVRHGASGELVVSDEIARERGATELLRRARPTGVVQVGETIATRLSAA